MPRRYTGGFLSTKEQATDANTANGIFTVQEAGALTTAGNFPTGRWTPQRSLRLRSASSAYLNRTPASDGNRQTWTMSLWVKRGVLSTDQNIFNNFEDSPYTNEYVAAYFTSSNAIDFYCRNSGATVIGRLTTTQVFRDPSAWYHIVVVADTTNATSANRLRLYVNGNQITAFSTATYPSQNANLGWNLARQAWIAAAGDGAYFDGYMTDINFIDGQALTPPSFAETDPQTGTWIPKRYTGTYGTNGFYLPFENPYLLGRDRAPSTNLVRNSEAFNSWSLSGVTVGANNQTDPIAGSTADTLTATNSDAVAYTFVPTQTGTTYTFSVYLKAASATTISLLIDKNSTGSAGYEVASCSVTTSWQRFSITGVAAGQTIAVLIGGGASFSSPEAVYAWGAQVEAGNVATTYVASGTGNDWTTNNISTSAGVTYDSMVDVPGIPAVSAQADIGNVQRGNYCTWNRLGNIVSSAGATFTNANLTVASASGAYLGCMGTMSFPLTGKFYYEAVLTGNSNPSALANFGISENNIAINANQSGTGAPNGASWYIGNASLIQTPAGTLPSTGLTVTGNSAFTFQVAIDCDSGNVFFGCNNVWYSNTSATTGNPSAGLNPSVTLNNTGNLVPWFFGYALGIHTNFGQQPFVYTPPTGFKSLCTTNLPNPIIKRPSDHFDVKLWTGNGKGLTVGTTTKQTSTYAINKSIRFRSSESAYLNRTFVTPTNNKIFTYSVWTKRGAIDSYTALLSAASAGTGYTTLRFESNNQLVFQEYTGSAYNYQFYTTQRYTDTTAWYHIIVTVDTTQTNPSSRVKIYVNGSQVTALSTAAYPTLNSNPNFNSAVVHRIGANNYQGEVQQFFHGYMAEVNFVDGQTLTPTSFGTFDANNNWMPQRYTGTYGNNGFYLPFNHNTTSSFAATFNGSNQYLTVPDSSVWAFTGSFTIEAFFYVTTTSPVLQSIVSQWVDSGGTDRATTIGVNSSGQLTCAGQYGANQYSVTSPSSTIKTNVWYHVAMVVNGTTLTLYLNGVSQGSTTVSGTLNNSTAPLGIGAYGNNNYQISGSISNVRITNTAVYTANFTIPTTALTAISGTQLLTLQNATLVDNSTNNFTITNVNSATISSANPFIMPSLASDQSGNINNWIPYSFSTVVGATYDSMFDSPTDTVDSSGNVIGNYALFNPSDVNGATIINGGLQLRSTGTAAWRSSRSTLTMNTGKWYAEFRPVSNTTSAYCDVQIGVLLKNSVLNGEFTAMTGIVYSSGDGTTYVNNSNVGVLVAAYTYGDILGVAFDADTGNVSLYKNNSLQNTSNVGTLRQVEALFGISAYSRGGGTITVDANFGQQPFAYTPPAGFKAINTKNLKDVGSYNLPDSFGNFVNSPDLVWVKSRSTTGTHVLTDTVRGPNNNIYTNLTTANTVATNKITGFQPNGFTLGSDDGTGTGDVNYAGTTYAGWAWNRGKTPGFDIVNYAGTGAVQHVPHNLGQQPGFMMIKATNGAAAQQWRIWHKGIATANYFLSLPDTGYGTADANIFPNPPSNSTFTVGSGNSAGGSSYSYIAYLWAEVPGFSKIGTYTGNSSADGPFVYCGFKPRFILARQLTTAYGWIILDTERSKNNPTSVWVNPEATTAEGSPVAEFYDILSNGFKLRYSGAFNTSGASHAYMAFAENPFKYATAR